MKIFITIFIAVLPYFCVSQDYDLTINISNIKTKKGSIQIGLYDDPKVFPEVGKEMQRFYIEVDSKDFSYTLKDLQKGTYAIAIYHDLNNDKECNTNFIGIPKEPYGFSNNIKPVFSAPSFKKTAIVLNEDKEIMIKLR